MGKDGDPKEGNEWMTMQERLSIPSHLLLLSILAGASSASALESATTRLRLDPANGSIVSIVDKPSGRDFAAKPAPLYELNFAGPELRLTSLDAVGVTVKEDDRGLVVEAPRHGETAVHVTCTFRPLDGSPFILGRIEIRLDEPRKLASVRFPTVNLSLPLGDAGNDDAVLLPYCDGCVVTNPLVNGVNRKLQYPGSASMQLFAAFDKTAGVYLACHDSHGHLKRFSVQKRESALHLSVDHVPEFVSVREWSLSYDVAISTFRGVSGADSTTWEDAAELYRSWAVEQPWCRRTLAQRISAGDVPKWLTQPSLFYAYSLRGDSKEGKRINRLPLVVEQADAWREVTDGPTTFMLMAWEKHGAWVTPDYFPPFGGADAFRAATSELHARGHRTLVFLSGLKWTLQKNTKGGIVDDREEFDRRGRAHAIGDPTGKAAIYGEPEHGVGQHAQICAATPLAREILLDSTLQCQQLGIDCVQVDQIVGGGLPPCYHPDHGHPPGGGNWCAKRLYDTFAEVRRKAKAVDPDFAFAIEEPSEFFIPVLDTYHARDYKQASWPRTGRGVVGVPLFTHVYHDYVHGYGGDGCQVSAEPWPVSLYQQATNLVCGKSPGVAVWQRSFDPRSTHELQRRMLRSHFDLWRGPAREFLVFGRRIASPALNVPTREVSFYDWKKKTRTALEVPSVLHSAWRLPDGRTGCVFACVAPQEVSFEALGHSFSLQPGEAAFRILE